LARAQGIRNDQIERLREASQAPMAQAVKFCASLSGFPSLAVAQNGGGSAR
jgi:protein-disulfide isomerase-like protein with CxxC motif